MTQVTVDQAVALAEQHQRAGQLQIAINLYRQVLSLEPARPLHNALGHVLLSAGMMTDAICVFEEGTRRRPEDFITWSNLGSAHQMNGNIDSAIHAHERALALAPRDVGSLCNMALALRSAGRLDEATATAHAALEADPSSAAALQILGDLLIGARKLEEAAAVVQRALELSPHDAINHSNHGILLHLQGELDASIEALRQSIRLAPSFAEAHNNLANVLRELGDVEAAIQHFRKAVELKPDYTAAHSALLLSMQYRATDPRELEKEHQAWERQHAAPQAPMRKRHAMERDPHRRLKIGYVSADFREHPVRYFIEPLLEHHDRQQVEVYCYSDVPRPDEVTGSIKTFAEHWRETAALPHAAIADRIRADQIDVLVDLSLHSGASRLVTFAAQPAPVQISYLGYAGSPHLSFIDHHLTDNWLEPGADPIAQLKGGFCCYRPPEAAPNTIPTNPERITFGSFNNLAKISPETLGWWCAILREVKDSTLLVQARGADQPSVQHRWRNFFREHGVSESRLVLKGAEPLANYLRSMSRIDIMLDTFPFNGHTTSCHAMWLGAALVSRYGQTPVSRVGLSLLSSLRLEELAVPTWSQYLAKSVELAHSPQRLLDLRQTMRQRMLNSSLTDAARIAREVEGAFRRMWAKWCSHH
ncbi:MAG TPA: tetratricopeptide repeat protein [Tepidisphaeraceae bacterium]|jgi:predicted O-linked N-acetylglucosamine transferase (SPINDLY family)